MTGILFGPASRDRHCRTVPELELAVCLDRDGGGQWQIS